MDVFRHSASRWDEKLKSTDRREGERKKREGRREGGREAGWMQWVWIKDWMDR